MACLFTEASPKNSPLQKLASRWGVEYITLPNTPLLQNIGCIVQGQQITSEKFQELTQTLLPGGIWFEIPSDQPSPGETYSWILQEWIAKPRQKSEWIGAGFIHNKFQICHSGLINWVPRSKSPELSLKDSFLKEISNSSSWIRKGCDQPSFQLCYVSAYDSRFFISIHNSNHWKINWKEEKDLKKIFKKIAQHQPEEREIWSRELQDFAQSETAYFLNTLVYTEPDLLNHTPWEILDLSKQVLTATQYRDFLASLPQSVPFLPLFRIHLNPHKILKLRLYSTGTYELMMESTP